MSPSDPILIFDNVSKHFGGVSVVEELSFAVQRGSCTGLIGPNGAGKTTVFDLITGFYPIDTGQILLDGVDIANMQSRYRIRHGVARNFQNIRLIPHLSTLENVMVGQHCQNRGLFGVLQPVAMMPGNRWREGACRRADHTLAIHGSSILLPRVRGNAPADRKSAGCAF